VQTIAGSRASRRWPLVVAALAVTLSCWLAYRLLHPRTLADDAESVYRALVANDAKAMFRYVSHKEKQLYGWTTPERFQEFYERLVRPKIYGCKDFRLVEKYLSSPVNPSQGICEISFRLANGWPQKMMIIANAGDDHGEFSAIFDLLYVAWKIKFAPTRPEGQPSMAERVMAPVRGYLEDRATMDSLGISSLPEPDLDRPNEPYTWEHWKANRVAYVERITSRKP
jgi:hypothetical protein